MCVNDCVNEFITHIEKGEIRAVNVISPIIQSKGRPYATAFFRNIGECKRRRVVSSDDLDQLLDCYLVWYKKNDEGEAGWDVIGSLNYQSREYVEGLFKKLSGLPHASEAFQFINSFMKGWVQPINIFTIKDTSLNKAVIVDGTKRALALFYLKRRRPKSLNRLITSCHPIYIFEWKWSHMRCIFPCDFMKFCLDLQNSRNSKFFT